MNALMAPPVDSRHLLQKDPDVEGCPQRSSPSQKSKICLLIFLVGTVVLLAVGAVGGMAYNAKEDGAGNGGETLFTISPGMPNPLKFGSYRFAAVTSDVPECSTIGTKMLAIGGSAVDSAIAALICLGVMSPQSSGIGGGSFMVVYDRSRDAVDPAKERVNTLDFRETAPEATDAEFYNKNHRRKIHKGPYSIAVPGEIRGYHTAWQRYGRLPWYRLFEPSIELCREGYRFQTASAEYLENIWDEIKDIPSWRELFINNSTGEVYQAQETMTNPLLANTLERIAQDPEGFYIGNLAKDILADLQEAGSVITAEDLASYTPLWKEPVTTRLKSGSLQSFSMPPPGSGAIYHFMLKLMEGYNPKPQDIQYLHTAIPAYHRIAETFKFGFAERTHLGDPDFVNLTEYLQRWEDPDYIASVRGRIDDEQTHDVPYYHPTSSVTRDGGGTTHVSVMAADGSAVSVTSTINGRYGSHIRGSRTGIIFNNEMDDFSLPGPADEDGLEPNADNYPVPGKRPLSSMVPTIMLDEIGNVRLVIGGAGFWNILTGTTYTTLHHLWYGLRIDRAINRARLHHSLSPNFLEYEDWFSTDVLQGLAKKGHNLTISEKMFIQAISSTCDAFDMMPTVSTCIQAASDGRNEGQPDGF